MSKKKGSRGGRSNELLAQMGMLPGMGYGDDDDDDDDLEAELMALQGMTSPPKQSSRKKEVLDLAAVGKMAEDAANVDGDEDDDVDDSELLAELQELSGGDEPKPVPRPSPQPSPSRAAPPAPAPRFTSPSSSAQQMSVPAPVARAPSPSGPAGKQGMVSLLQERLELYNSAYSLAQAEGNSSKARRLNRGIKTLKDLIKQAKAGKAIPEDEIPPVVQGGPTGGQQESSPAATPMETAPSPPAPSQPQAMETEPAPLVSLEETDAPLSAEVQQSIAVMTERREQYKIAAVEAKKSGDMETARSYFRTAKQFDTVINAANAGKPVDLSKMPPPPSSASTPSVHVERNATQGHGEVAGAAAPQLEFDVPEDSSVDKDLFGAPDAPKTVLEALQQRLAKYKSVVEQAKNEGNSSKARRMGRISKQYEDAIKAHKAGQPVDYSELPTPPGFAPIPTESAPAQQMSPPAASPQRRSPAAAAAGRDGQAAPVARSPPKPAAKRMSGEGAGGKLQQQLVFLLERQKQFKVAALKAKQSGDKEQAMAYLRQAKGFDPMIESLHNGIRVDMSKVPRPPGMEEENLQSYEFVEVDDCTEQTGDRDEMFKKLEQDLINQIRISGTNSNHFTHTGDIAAADRFDKLGQNCRKDLDALKNAYKYGDPVPRFHYETKEFKIVKCCTDLADNDLDLSIVRGIHYNPPSGYTPEQLDTYVKYEFPFPTDDCPKGQTDTVKNTACPEYDKSFKIPINRKSRSFQRMMKLKFIKFEIYYRRGILKSDKVLGTASIKLQPLETHCELHECLDLMDGRRPCGGRLEVRVRIREPLLSKEEETVKEKWLVIDKFNRSLKPESTRPRARSRSPAANSGATSIEVLRFEKQLLDKKIATYQRQLTPAQMTSLQQKSQQLQEQALKIQQGLKQGGINAYREYAASIEQMTNQYLQEAKALVEKGEREKAQIAMSKKKLIDKEVAAIRSKIPA